MLEKEFKRAMNVLENYGLLLVTDQAFPSVAGIVVGEPIRGSWWAHPKSHDIFGVNVRLVESGQVIVCKLVSGKQTFVHWRLWPAVAAVGKSRESWQLRTLSQSAVALLERVCNERIVRTDLLPKTDKTLAASSKELETRLLVYSEDVHTDTGAHAKSLESWESWLDRHGIRNWPDATAAKHEIEKAVASINRDFESKGELPWQ